MTRFDLDMDGSMESAEHGRWVRYEDVAEALAAQQYNATSDHRLMDMPARQEPVALPEKTYEFVPTPEPAKWHHPECEGECIACLIERVVQEAYGSQGLGYLQRHLTSPPAQRKPLTDEQKDAARWRFLVDNSFDKEGVTQFHVWEHSWEPHSQTGEQTEWKQRVRGPALDRFIDRAIEAAHNIKENT